MRKEKVMKRVFAIFMALLLFVQPLANINFYYADNDRPVLTEGQVAFDKLAQKVDGKINTWRIKVKFDAKDLFKPTDYVLVFDRSGSMRRGNRLVEAKSATKEIIADIFEKNENNRVGLVSFSSKANYEDGWDPSTEYTVHTQSFPGSLMPKSNANITYINSEVDNIFAKGGTSLQKAVHVAGGILEDAKDADPNNERKRVLIVFTDGVPTYGANIKWDMIKDNYTQYFAPNDNGQLESLANIPEAYFDYDARIGDSSSTIVPYENEDNIELYVNLLKTLKSEVKFIEDSNKNYVDDFYFISYENDDTATEQLREMVRDPNKHYKVAQEDTIDDTLHEIVDDINFDKVTDVRITDEIGEGFILKEDTIVLNGGDANSTVTYNAQTNQIICEVGTPANEFIDPQDDRVQRWAELTYELEAAADIQTVTPAGGSGNAASG